MRSNYGINNHKISIDLIDNNKVFINIVNPKNDVYESITHISDLNSIFGNNDTYNIISECFKKTPNYILTTAFKDDVYYLKFQTNFQIYHMTFLIKVGKKNKYDQEMALWNEIMNNIDFIYIQFTKNSINFSKKRIKESIHEDENNISYIYILLHSTNVVIHNISDTYKIKYLHKLDKLTITTDSRLLDFENCNLKTLILIASKLESLKGIHKFPKLETLELESCNILYDIKSYLSDTNIKKIVFRNCGDNQKRNMISYCNAKNIELSYV